MSTWQPCSAVSGQFFLMIWVVRYVERYVTVWWSGARWWWSDARWWWSGGRVVVVLGGGGSLCREVCSRCGEVVLGGDVVVVLGGGDSLCRDACN